MYEKVDAAKNQYNFKDGISEIKTIKESTGMIPSIHEVSFTNQAKVD
jgi:hypothetical protein